MVTRRSAKNKGNQFEYETAYNLEEVELRVTLTKELGFQKQYDILVEHITLKYKTFVECKFHKSISWNEAKKYFLKLEDVTREDFVDYRDKHLLIFKSNQQPVLVMYREENKNETISVTEFESYFGREWRKREKVSKKTKRTPK